MEHLPITSSSALSEPSSLPITEETWQPKDLEKPKEQKKLKEWIVLTLPYPREEKQFPQLTFTWKKYSFFNLPQIKMSKQWREDQKSLINHDQLAQKLEALLNSRNYQEYELFSLTPTQTGEASLIPFRGHNNNPFLSGKTGGKISSKESLLIVLRKKKNA